MEYPVRMVGTQVSGKSGLVNNVHVGGIVNTLDYYRLLLQVTTEEDLVEFTPEELNELRDSD